MAWPGYPPFPPVDAPGCAGIGVGLVLPGALAFGSKPTFVQLEDATRQCASQRSGEDHQPFAVDTTCRFIVYTCIVLYGLHRLRSSRTFLVAVSAPAHRLARPRIRCKCHRREWRRSCRPAACRKARRRRVPRRRSDARRSAPRTPLRGRRKCCYCRCART